MIRPGEIQRIARGAGVRDQQIEKDYVLSWILNGIAHHDRLSGIMAFKGGAVLKKFYFENYRFSEDLDFTLLDDKVSNDQIFSWFRETFEYIRNEANIPLEIIDNNEHEDGGINFYIGYIGPLGGLGSNKKVKVDISKSEKLEFDPVRKSAFPDYSDLEPIELLCYQLEEVLVEKLRSVMQRMQARDFYDIWYLLEKHGMAVDFLNNEFSNKCISKGLSADDFHSKLEARMPQYKGRWRATLGEQIHDLPDFEQVEREVTRHLKKLPRR
jgi:predicted nucleotidyltransferase component of viral defense system